MAPDASGNQRYDTIVVGGGLAGATAVLALARQGLRVAFVAPPPEREDHRTTALLIPSVEFLDDLGVWESVRERSAPLQTMRIIDGTRRLLRAPTMAFHAGEIGLNAFGYNIANRDLVAALTSAIVSELMVTPFAVAAAESRTDDKGAVVRLADGTALRADLVVGADGRQSVVRSGAGIGARTWSYRQAAIVTTFSHRFPHENISTEFHTEHGPFTQVPLPGERSSLVWVMEPREAALLVDLGPDNLGRAIEERMQSMLGAVTVDGPVQQFPIGGMVAHAFGRGRSVLVGEAGHVIAPIGAQGLNLGLRDVKALRDVVEAHRSDLGRLAAAYDRARRFDTASRAVGVDVLNRSLLSDFLPIHLARAAGLTLLMRVPPLRRSVMREGMQPGSALNAGRLNPFQQLRERLDEVRARFER